MILLSPKENNHEHYYTKKPKSKIKLRTINYNFDYRRYTFTTSTGIFSFKKIDKGTEILLKSLKLPQKEDIRILDLGCGYGVIGIILADLLPNADVIMIDINERAVWLCQKNIKLNNIRNAVVKQSDLFKNIDEKFDLIVTNPPISLGKDVLYEIFQKSYKYLISGGSFQFVIRTRQGAKSAGNKIREIFNTENVELLNIKSGYRVFYASKI
ncbi:MAG: class I SAM-dependent methyltransferase [Promethearchaeota archaeon]|nr:MAG: class I SAM-dependent methyltransferase [Candidatus Lokiarchaeota archaeon]